MPKIIPSFQAAFSIVVVLAVTFQCYVLPYSCLAQPIAIDSIKIFQSEGNDGTGIQNAKRVENLIIWQPFHILNGGIELGYERRMGHNSIKLVGGYARPRSLSLFGYYKAKFEAYKCELQYKYYLDKNSESDDFSSVYVGAYGNIRGMNLRSRMEAEKVFKGNRQGGNRPIFERTNVEMKGKGAAATVGVLIGKIVTKGSNVDLDLFAGAGFLMPLNTYEARYLHIGFTNPYRLGGLLKIGASFNFKHPQKNERKAVRSPTVGFFVQKQDTSAYKVSLFIKPLALLLGGIDMGMERRWSSSAVSVAAGYYRAVNNLYDYGVGGGSGYGAPGFGPGIRGTKYYYEAARAEGNYRRFLKNPERNNIDIIPYIGVFGVLKTAKIQARTKQYETLNGLHLASDYGPFYSASASFSGVFSGFRSSILPRFYIDVNAGLGYVMTIKNKASGALALDRPIFNPFREGVRAKFGLNLYFALY